MPIAQLSKWRHGLIKSLGQGLTASEVAGPGGQARGGRASQGQSLGARELGLGLIGSHCSELKVRVRQLGLGLGLESVR